MEQQDFDGQACAKLFKYYMQERKPYLKFKLPFHRIQAKGCYQKHQAAFDRTAAFFMKNRLDLNMYMRFFVVDQVKNEFDVDSDLYSFGMIKRFADELQIRSRKRKIFEWVNISAKKLAEICVQNKLPTAKDGLKFLINNRMLASLYMSGGISNYFLAGIPRFDEVVKRLDPMSRNEMKDLVDRFDMYQKETDEAFKYMKNMKPNPLKMSDNLIKSDPAQV